MMSNVSHEFRTPLNSILSSNEFMMKYVASISKDEKAQIFEEKKQKIMRWANVCKTSSRLLLSLVNDILDLSRMDNEVFKINPENTNISSLMTLIDDIFWSQCEAKNIEFSIEVSEDLKIHPVQIDSQRVS